MKVVPSLANFCTITLAPRRVVSFIRYEIPTDYRHYEGGRWHVHQKQLPAVVDFATKFCGVEVDLSELPATLRASLNIHTEADPYTILHLRPTAPPSVIKAAYRALCKDMHPDRGGSTEQAIQLNKAYQQVLSEHSGRNHQD